MAQSRTSGDVGDPSTADDTTESVRVVTPRSGICGGDGEVVDLDPDGFFAVRDLSIILASLQENIH
jgi:hypothetical protein